MAPSCCCSRSLVLALLLLSAIPLATIIALERRAAPGPSAYHYRSRGWLRECAKWDDEGRRFLVSTFSHGGVAEIAVVEGGLLEEKEVFREADVAGNASLGIAVDRPRGRLLVVFADEVGNRYSAVGAYDLASWDRIFLTVLSGPEDEQSYADDVAVDAQGNAYVTDVRSNKIWKVSPTGEVTSVIRSNTFRQKPQFYYNFLALNGIVYHPDGYLLVIHTSSGYLFKVDTATEEVSVVRVTSGSLLMGDGLELVGPTKVVVAGSLGTLVVESFDGWATARVTGRYFGAMHRIASAATVKDGRVYVSHLVGGGVRERTHVISEAVFSPVSP